MIPNISRLLYFQKYLLTAERCFTLIILANVVEEILFYLAIQSDTLYFAPGEMAEWSIAAVLKTVDCYRSGGSNPSLSALSPLKGLFLCPLLS